MLGGLDAGTEIFFLLEHISSLLTCLEYYKRWKPKPDKALQYIPPLEASLDERFKVGRVPSLEGVESPDNSKIPKSSSLCLSLLFGTNMKSQPRREKISLIMFWSM